MIRRSALLAIAAWAGLVVLAGILSSSLLSVSWRQAFVAPQYHGGYPFLRWDARHFIDIAQYGYHVPALAAFFPLFPAVVRLIAKGVSVPYTVAAVAAAALSFGASWWFWMRLDVVRKSLAPPWNIFAILTLPTAFIFLAPYTESLFWLETVALLWALQQRRYGLAGACVATASLTRPYGILLLLPLIFAQRREHNTDSHRWLLTGVLATLPVIAWCILVSLSLARPFAPLAAELNGFHLAHPAFPLAEMVQNLTFWRAENPAFAFLAVNQLLGLVAAVVGLWGVWRTWPRVWFITCLLLVMVYFGHGTLNSSNRFVFSTVPLVVGLWTVVTPRWRWPLALFGFALLVINAALFARWYFVV